MKISIQNVFFSFSSLLLSVHTSTTFGCFRWNEIHFSSWMSFYVFICACTLLEKERFSYSFVYTIYQSINSFFNCQVHYWINERKHAKRCCRNTFLLLEWFSVWMAWKGKINLKKGNFIENSNRIEYKFCVYHRKSQHLEYSVCVKSSFSNSKHTITEPLVFLLNFFKI